MDGRGGSWWIYSHYPLPLLLLMHEVDVIRSVEHPAGHQFTHSRDTISSRRCCCCYHSGEDPFLICSHNVEYKWLARYPCGAASGQPPLTADTGWLDRKDSRLMTNGIHVLSPEWLSHLQWFDKSTLDWLMMASTCILLSHHHSAIYLLAWEDSFSCHLRTSIHLFRLSEWVLYRIMSTSVFCLFADPNYDGLPSSVPFHPLMSHVHRKYDRFIIAHQVCRPTFPIRK